MAQRKDEGPNRLTNEETKIPAPTVGFGQPGHERLRYMRDEKSKACRRGEYALRITSSSGSQSQREMVEWLATTIGRAGAAM